MLQSGFSTFATYCTTKYIKGSVVWRDNMSISRVVCGGWRLRDSISHILTGVWTSGGHHITHCLIHHCWSLGLVNSTTWRRGNVYTDSKMKQFQYSAYPCCKCKHLLYNGVFNSFKSKIRSHERHKGGFKHYTIYCECKPS